MNNNEQEKMTRKEQATRTRRKLFSAGLQIFSERDMDSVCIKDICSAAGVSVGTFYHYYGSKEDLLLEAYRFFDEEIVTRARRKKYGSVLEALYFIIAYQCGNHEGLFDEESDAQILEIMMDYKTGELLLWQQVLRTQLKTGGKSVIEPNRSMNFYIRELVMRAISVGELVSDTSPSEIADTILRISRGTMFDWAVRNGAYRAYEYALRDVKSYLSSLVIK
ncbi:MAG: TetR/AcrR family transcriptional regulator [Oscillospiraceae bacterium]|nr:TetR/AcrR family transcriptional regulator [Oscillospiraceae bacterium]